MASNLDKHIFLMKTTLPYSKKANIFFELTMTSNFEIKKI